MARPGGTPAPTQTFAVLCCLLTQAGQLVTKDALLEAVWPETVVSESVLTAAIRQLRRVLTDRARTPQFIETVHSRGYRFIAPVVVAAPATRRPRTAETWRARQPVAPVHADIFVGRQGELAQMHQWFGTALQGKRQVGIIAGEPGIGKTALVDTFVAQVSAGEDLHVGHGQSVESYGVGEPYLPVREALGRLCREPDGIRLVSVLRQYAPSWLVQMPALLPRAEWEALQRMGAYHQAIAYAQRTLILATADGEIVLQALANLYLGNSYQYQGDYPRAIHCFRQIVAALKGVQRRERFGQVNPPAVLCRAHLAWCHAELGTFPEGRALGEEGLRIAEAVASPVSVMYAAWGIGLLALRQGDLPRALPVLERAVAICRDADLPNYFPRVAPTLGAAYTLCGRIDDAVPLLERGMEQAMALERVDLQAFCRLALGEAYLLAGHLEEAQVLAEGALAPARGYKERGNQAYALRLRGQVTDAVVR
jgi:DNA-binding winged helix-turn-helix (wHTH) protein/tetratricopeptide (TPR) repeat protein